MTLHQRSSRARFSAASLGFAPLLQRFSYAIFIGLAAVLLLFGKINPQGSEHFRATVIDGLAPALDALSRPGALIANTTSNISSYFSLKSENDQLKKQVADMVLQQQTLLKLEHENSELRTLLNFKAEQGASYITARVIADTGGAFVRSMIITAGKADGVKEGMAVISGDGLIGRITELGEWSSRVLLVTDMNSRVPVTFNNGTERAIMAGDNSPNPQMLYTVQDGSEIEVGSPVLTSGHGGIFPPGLMIGTLQSTKNGGYEVQLSSNLSRINIVRLVDYTAKTGSLIKAPSQPPASTAKQHRRK